MLPAGPTHGVSAHLGASRKSSVGGSNLRCCPGLRAYTGGGGRLRGTNLPLHSRNFCRIAFGPSPPIGPSSESAAAAGLGGHPEAGEVAFAGEPVLRQYVTRQCVTVPQLVKTEMRSSSLC